MPPSPILFSTPCLLILENFASFPFYSRLRTVNSGSVWSLGKAMLLFFTDHKKLFSDYNEARHSMKRRIKQKNKWFFMLINYLCISYVLFVDIFTKSFDGFISMKFLIAVFLPASPFIPTSLFINFGDFCQPRLLHPPCLLFWPKFASLLVYYALPLYLKLESNLKSSQSLIPGLFYFSLKETGLER